MRQIKSYKPQHTRVKNRPRGNWRTKDKIVGKVHVYNVKAELAIPVKENDNG